MATIKEPEDPGFPPVYLIKPGDDVEGGENGISNIQAKQLVERTAYLKEKIEAIDLEGHSGGGGSGTGGDSGGGDTDEGSGGGTTIETPPQPATFIGLTANGSATATTTALTLIFDKDIDGLNAADITLNALETGATKGALTRTGMGSYTLAISGVIKGGNVMVFVSKDGYSITGSPGMVSIYFFPVVSPGTQPRNLALVILGREVTNAADVTAIITVVSNTVKAGNINNLVIGDYFGLASINIAAGYLGYGAFSATLADIGGGDYGRNLDFVLVAKNPYLSKNGNSQPHVFFQSRHVLSKNPNIANGGHIMDIIHEQTFTKPTNAGGYLASKGRQFVTTEVRAALIAAGIPLGDSAKCPNISRRVANGGSGATATDIITDNITLLTEYELFGTHTYSGNAYEPATGQTHFSENYANAASRIKRKADGAAVIWWMASPYTGNSTNFCIMLTSGDRYYNNSDGSYGIAPAFTVG